MFSLRAFNVTKACLQVALAEPVALEPHRRMRQSRSQRLCVVQDFSFYTQTKSENAWWTHPPRPGFTYGLHFNPCMKNTCRANSCDKQHVACVCTYICTYMGFAAHTNSFSVSNSHLSMYPLHNPITFLPASCPPPPLSLFFIHCTVQSPPTVDCKPPTIFLCSSMHNLSTDPASPWRQTFLTAQMSVLLHTIVWHAIVFVTFTWMHLCVLASSDEQPPLCSDFLI